MQYLDNSCSLEDKATLGTCMDTFSALQTQSWGCNREIGYMGYMFHLLTSWTKPAQCMRIDL